MVSFPPCYSHEINLVLTPVISLTHHFTGFRFCQTLLMDTMAPFFSRKLLEDDVVHHLSCLSDVNWWLEKLWNPNTRHSDVTPNQAVSNSQKPTIPGPLVVDQGILKEKDMTSSE